jgi:AraC-like DNA-binding protein
MTANDNPLTKSATGIAVSYAASDLRVFVQALDRLGYKVAELLAMAHLSKGDLNQPDARISCEKFGAVIGGAMRQRAMKNLGARMAAVTPIGSFPLLDYLVMTSNNVGDSMRRLVKYFRLVGAPTSFDIREDESPVRIMLWSPNNVFSLEFTLSLIVLYLREETDGRCNPEFVALSYKPEDASEIEQLLSCDVRSDTTWTGVAYSRVAWQLPLRRRDSVLHGLLQRQADEVIAHLPAGDGVIFSVKRVLAKRVGVGDTSIDSVAKELATSARTLQRRLAVANASFQDLLEQTRQETAERYLRNLALSIAEVSYLLGYSEPSALHRAFRRWRGLTPQAFREQIASSNGA